MRRCCGARSAVRPWASAVLLMHGAGRQWLHPPSRFGSPMPIGAAIGTIILAMNRLASAADRAWTRLPSGRRLDLANPDPQAWTDEDMAIRLARTSRWAGESRWSEPLSVAQHSLLVLAIAEQRAGASLPPARALRELLHDAEEGLLGFDCNSPLKTILGERFEWTSQRLLKAVWKRYALPHWSTADHAAHKEADRVAAAAEAVHVVGWSEEEIRSVLGIDSEVLVADPLAQRYDCEPWRPWPAQQAMEAFLAELRSQLVRRSAG